MAFSVNLAMICIFSFLAGCGIGGDLVTIGSVFIEFCPPSKSWRFTLLNAVCAIGGVIVPVIAYLYTIAGTPDMWRWVTLTNGALNFLSWTVRFYVFETPKYLISAGNSKEAERILKAVAKINNPDYIPIQDLLLSEVSLEEIDSRSGSDHFPNH
jgi:MFS family permease